MNKVEKAILKTLAFFAIFERPLTLDEIWHFLYKVKASKLQVLFNLRKLERGKVIFQQNGYFSLIKNKKIFSDFKERKILFHERWQKVYLVSKLLKFIPFIRNISVINSLALKGSKEESDIDILLVTEKNHLWTTRAFVVFLLEIIGQNKNKWYRAGKFCLGFALDEKNLDLFKLRSKDDIYFAYLIATMTPVLDKKIYKKLIEENAWIFKELPNWQPNITETITDKKSFLEKILSGRFGQYLENFLAKIQIKLIWSLPGNISSEFSLITTAGMMNLHLFDKLYSRKWQEKVKDLIT